MSKCPVCGSKAYVGLSVVECENRNCQNAVASVDEGCFTRSTEENYLDRGQVFFFNMKKIALVNAPLYSFTENSDAGFYYFYYTGRVYNGIRS